MTHQSLSTRGLIIWLLAAIFFLYEFFLRTFVGTLAQHITTDLQLGATQFALMGTAYYISYGLMQIPVGILADRFGTKKLLVFAASCCALSTLIFAQAQGFYVAFFSRLLMGFASSFAFVCLLIVTITWFPRKHFGLFVGISQFIGTMGPLIAAGPLAAIIQASQGNWRTPLKQVAIAGFALTCIMMLVMKEKKRESKKIIYLKPNESIASRIGRLLNNKQAWTIACYSACIYLAMALLGDIWGTSYLQSRGMTYQAAASMISLTWFGYAMGCPTLGALSDRLNRRKSVLILSAILGVVTTCCIVYLPYFTVGFTAVQFFMLGIAASGQSVGFVAISEHVNTENRMAALGLNNAAMTSFASIMPIIVSYLIKISGAANYSTLINVKQYIFALSVLPLLNGVALFLALMLMQETYCKPQKEAIILTID